MPAEQKMVPSQLMDLTFLKLGGSLITDKDTPRTPRRDVLARLAVEIAAAHATHPGMRLVLGHGSGSFGHNSARKHGTRQGVSGPRGWLGFAEVWREARALNQIVVETLSAAGLPVIAFPPSAALITHNGQVLRWDLEPMQAALDAGLIPLVNGDTVFDQQRGGTILSTEDLFFYLARQLHPRRILLAGLEEGVWRDFPACTQLIAAITPKYFADVAAQIGGSASVDVTGGMLEKVRSMLSLAETLPGFEAVIFSGVQPGMLQAVLLGKDAGTTIRQTASENR
jgi:isopentenyl phosphate kinase